MGRQTATNGNLFFQNSSFVAISENVKTEGRRHTGSKQSKGGGERERSLLDKKVDSKFVFVWSWLEQAISEASQIYTLVPLFRSDDLMVPEM